MRLRSVLGIAVLLVQTLTLGAALPGLAAAASGGVVISGLQQAGAAKSTDEFIELTNTGAADVSLAGWQIQYRAASATNGTDCTKGWSTKATVGAGTISSGGHYLFAPSIYLAADTAFSAGLAANGTVRLLDASKAPQDALAWGTGSCGAGTAAAAPPAGQSLERHSGAAGAHGDNAADFFVQSAPVAHSTTAAFGTPGPAAAPEAPATEAAPTPTATGTSHLALTELMVDPVAPNTDADDEFVEIKNAGDTPVNSAGYAVKTGSHTVKLPAGVIAPGQYVVISSADTSLSLTNSGGVANLVDPSGTIVDTAGAWGAAVPGASWALIETTWRWTLAPTPGADNEYTPVPGTAGAEGSGDYAEVQLSELLPDPASPLTDAADEFIELYNPGDAPVNVAGYVIKAGHDLGSKHVIKSGTVPANGFLVLKSSVTKLALSNDGSSVALYTPDGEQLGATVTYPKATSGSSWVFVEGTWTWTGEPTPGAANVVVSVAAAAAAAKASKAKATKAKAAAKPKAASKPKATPKPKAGAKPLLAAATSTGGRWLLFVLAGLTIAYIIYEFRYDIRNYYFKLRGYPTPGRPVGSAAKGRRGDRAA